MSGIVREEIIGDARLILGDCRKLLQEINPSAAIITDPPYGIGFRWEGVRRNGRRSGLIWGNRKKDRQPYWNNIAGDNEEFDPAPWLQFPTVILWGAQNFANSLPPSRGWLVWDKRRESAPDHHGDCELAWTNLETVVRCHRQIWRGLVREGEENIALESKLHPAQKPVALMRWCIGQAGTPAIVVDPYMGSGTTGIACAQLGCSFLGIEVVPGHFNIACRRIEEAQRQGRLFDERPKAPVQQPLFERAP